MSVKRFIQSKLHRVKADKSDAVMLAEYGCVMGVELWKLNASYYIQAQQLFEYSGSINQKPYFNYQSNGSDYLVYQSE